MVKRRNSMLIEIISITIFLSTCLTGCSTQSSKESDVQISTEPTMISDTCITTAEVIDTSETISVTETTVHNPIHIMQMIELGDALPDGEYFAGILDFDEDYSGATFVINGYYALSEEEVFNFEDGDTIKWGDEERTIVEETTSSGYTYLSFDGFYYLQKQNNGYCYLRGDYDEIPFYRIADSYHLSFDPNIAIYDYVDILGLHSISESSANSIDDILENAYQKCILS